MKKIRLDFAMVLWIMSVGALAWATPFFQLKHQRHPEQPSIDDEFTSLIERLNSILIMTDNRKPASGDQGLMWFHINGSQIDMYIRDELTGTWRGAVAFN